MLIVTFRISVRKETVIFAVANIIYVEQVTLLEFSAVLTCIADVYMPVYWLARADRLTIRDMKVYSSETVNADIFEVHSDC